MTAAIERDAVYTPAEAATLMRCGKTNVYDLIGKGDLAAVRVGAGSKGFRLRGADLLAFLDSRTAGGPGPRMAFKHLKV